MPRKADHRDNASAQGVAHRAKAKDKMVAEYYEREAASKPTPTQEENDLAKVGALDIDDKEDDGSESDEEVQLRTMEARLPGNNPYETRDMSADAPAEAPRRGRPRKAE